MTEAEFAQIVETSKPIVLSAIRQHLPVRFLSYIDDVAQETYLRAFRGLSSGFRGHSKVSTWLYTIARNESLRMAGKLIREEQKQQKLANSSNVDEHDQEVNNINKMIIDSLPIAEKELLQLKFEGYKEHEIAQKLKIAQGTVKSRFFRIKKRIQGAEG